MRSQDVEIKGARPGGGDAGSPGGLDDNSPGALGPVTDRGFVDDATSVLRAAQAAMTDLLDEAGLVGAKPTTIGRTLGVDKTLAWKIARFVEDAEAVGAARHMPGSAGVEIVLKAAAAHGVGERRVRAMRDADQSLRVFMRRHAGDRRSFEAMLAKGGRDDRIESEERKALYKSGSAIWGVRAKAQTLLLALRPSETDPDAIDVLQLGGMFGFERLRDDVPWIIRRLTNKTDSGSSETGFKREPLDPEGATGGGLPLVPRFCSGGMPEIRQFRADDGTVYDELAPSAVGKNGAVTFVTGELYRSAIPMHWSETNTEGRYKLTVRTPVEAVMFDLLLHRDLAHFGEPEMRVLGLLEDRPASGAGDSGRGGSLLYEPEFAHRLGTPPVMQSTRIGGYAGMVADAFGMGGWGDLDDYRGYRAELEYPPAPSCVMMVVPQRKSP